MVQGHASQSCGSASVRPSVTGGSGQAGRKRAATDKRDIPESANKL